MVKKRTKQEQPVEGFGTFYDRYVSWVTSTPTSKRATLLIVGLLIIGALSAFASLPLIDADWYIWVQSVVGFPAGVILFAILTGIAHNTGFKNTELFQLKERLSHNQRLRFVAVVVVIVIILFIFFGKYLPYGVGGTIIIAITLTIYNLMRRTPAEVSLARQGVVDPRDIKGESDDI